jgi:hypothetical protein
MAADFAILGDNTGSSAPLQQAVRDLPGGGLRFVTQARGIEYRTMKRRGLVRSTNHSGGHCRAWLFASAPRKKAMR